jgi:hypothetical protein
MNTPNPSRQRKNHSKTVNRKGKSEKRFGGRSNKKHGGSTAGQIKARFFEGIGSGYMAVPSSVNHRRDNKKSNRNRFAVKSKHKRRTASKN